MTRTRCIDCSSRHAVRPGRCVCEDAPYDPRCAGCGLRLIPAELKAGACAGCAPRGKKNIGRA